METRYVYGIIVGNDLDGQPDDYLVYVPELDTSAPCHLSEMYPVLVDGKALVFDLQQVKEPKKPEKKVPQKEPLPDVESSDESTDSDESVPVISDYNLRDQPKPDYDLRGRSQTPAGEDANREFWARDRARKEKEREDRKQAAEDLPETDE